MMKKFGVFAATALAIAVFALTPSSAKAQSYSGTWEITEDVTFPFSTGVSTYCMKLVDNGSEGFPHSGSATLNGNGISNLVGGFQVINGQFVAIFLVPDGGSGELDTQIFGGPASKGKIGNGWGLEGFNNFSGTATFVKKSNCEASR